MLVAEKRQYIETYYPRVTEKETPAFVPRSRAVPKTRSKAWRRVSHIILIIMGFALCSYTVARFAMISQNQQRISELEKTLARHQMIQEHLEVELASHGTLNEVEEFAKDNLEMDYPDEAQVLLVELPGQDPKETLDTETADADLTKEDNLWNKLISLLD